jgi:hypothetical protein
VTGPDAHVALDHAALRAAQHGADARAQLGQAERLGHVVVGARFESLDRVGFAVQRGQHDDRHHVAPGTQSPSDVVTGRARAERDVEQNHVVRALGGGVERRVAVADGGHAMALTLEGARQHLPQGAVVIDQQDVQSAARLHGRRG